MNLKTVKHYGMSIVEDELYLRKFSFLRFVYQFLEHLRENIKEKVWMRRMLS